MKEQNEMESHPSIPSRISLRAQESSSSPQTSSTFQRRSDKTIQRSALISAAKVALLGGLAAVTVVIPVSGVATPAISFASAGIYNASWSSLETQVDVSDTDTLHTDPAAATRAAIRDQVEIDKCLNNKASANGARTALTEEKNEPALFWPLANGSYHFSSPFGMRVNPVLGVYRLHSGVDMAGSMGTPVVAASDGVVLSVGGTNGLGYAVKIYHSHLNVSTVYGHMISGSSPLKVGQKVVAGQRIGKLGSSGNSTGPHVHFEVHKGNAPETNTAIDPQSWMSQHKARHINDGDGCN
ncbi:M23 family metallopeptidase [Boudabousia marimammalium]|uniref:M23 family metallopeptidase n=1 Tax=Boudabousia marimammalium TaxID=156892 RepID=UPI000ACFD567|nr:M23 family metallopeptidase [Boudabousia marimammalium]